MEKLVLIDGNSLLNRAYYATPLFTDKKGNPTNGIFGFIKLLLKIISTKKPSYLAVAFDLHAPTFRHKMYDAYKAGRKPMPEELVAQVPVLKDVLKTMGIKIYELEGYEADDIIGTIAKNFPIPTYIYTGDRDAYQLVDKTTYVCFTKKGVSELLELGEGNFKEEVGLLPSQIIDLKALMGDKSDNIPGVPGVGEKTAHNLLETYGTLDEIYKNIDAIATSLQNKLRLNEESAYFSRKLATINTSVPLEMAIADCTLRFPFPYAVKEKFAELDFKSLVTMDIFETEQSLEAKSANTTENGDHKEPHIIEIHPANISEAIDAFIAFESTPVKKFACYLDDKEFSFCIPEVVDKNFDPKGGNFKEYIMPIKVDLFNAGYFIGDLEAVLQNIFSSKKTVLLYDAKNVLRILKNLEIDVTAKYEDVSLMKYIVEALGSTETLDFCLNYYSMPGQYKAVGIYRLYSIYENLLNSAEKRLYKEVELPLSSILFDMENTGVSVDCSILDVLSKKYNDELNGLTEKIYALAGERFNINSTKQLGTLLFEKMGIGKDEVSKSKGKDKTNYSTSIEVLEKYADDYEIVRTIIRFRQVQKLNSTYVEGIKPYIRNGKIHTTYNQMNTVTGRLSSANPNLQNIPVRTDEGKVLRKIFTASPENVLIDADYSQIELRLLAHFSDCKELINAYREGMDIHALTASQVFDVPLEEVTAQMRRSAKAVNFGIIYGISPFGLAKDLGISPKNAKIYIDKYFDSYSDVRKYMEENVIRAKEKGYITTLLGRKRIINELKSSNYNIRSFGERAAMNMPLQGSSADIIKIAMINVSNRLKEENLKAKLVLQIHDELILDCPEKEIEAASAILKDCMENAVKLKVPLTVDIAVGKNWYDAKN